ncbi:MAG TPA: hypothetical protein VMF59_03745 [Bacteroidota bacterium]|nr:hypothetical protein [Bacteroidota bacterium]
MDNHPDPEVELLRHTCATLAYRAEKVLRDFPPHARGLRIGEGVRSPAEILSHLGDLMDWALSLARGAHAWREIPPRKWEDDVARFFESLRLFDQFLASGVAPGSPPGKLFQGPVADALTHVGQIALIRRAAGVPVRGENYFRAHIVPGRVGTDQSARRVEFD